MNGRRIHNYEIVSHLGEGGMGTVYKAQDTVLGRPVALKMLHATLLQQSHFLDRFQKEARLLAQLLHPNIAVIYNLIEQEGQQYMVMEYVEGRNLETFLQQDGSMRYEAVVPIFLQALEGLHHAHRKGIFHRDIKPSNLILTPDGTVKLMDFGIAMMAGDQRLTQVNRMVGTLGYMAPELIEAKPPSVASDLYAIGVTMYELLTGKLPFSDATDYHLMQNILKQKPVSPDKLNPSLPKALSAILLKALEKNPANRFASAQEMKTTLAKAFPALAHADISQDSALLHRAAPRATMVISQPTRVQSNTPPETRMVARPQASLWYRVRDKLPTGKKRMMALGLLLLVLLLVAAAWWLGDSPAPAAVVTAKTDSNTVKRTVTNEPPVQGGSLADQRQQPAPSPLPVPVYTRNEEEGTEKKKEEKHEPIPDESKIGRKRTDAPEEKKEPVKEVVADPKPVVEIPKVEEVKRPSRTVRLAHAPDVALYLTSSLDANAKTRQSLTFRVTREVRYDGAVIIEQGATATGYIKSVGSKKISIVVSTVMGVNGQALAVQEEEVSGRIDDMVSNRDYLVSLKKGIEIHL